MRLLPKEQETMLLDVLKGRYKIDYTHFKGFMCTYVYMLAYMISAGKVE